ncbi:copper amine oxidase N-terminal domain-containing protein [Paenibacillus sp. GCM10012307]|uniref:Copper amine oxidase N-terminal domain-containing protein n=1 Tax=Paenibacillus roseus TaxID=2798579 RepID=A0A934J739_9BACL|nr:copper amine oxidase N-terminal domain-containing protein [Paenibacillus roseus]MBJ6361956.1 copper amine oxidase N-terminal domain-containing protein [Paenibacillus roseus]
MLKTSVQWATMLLLGTLLLPFWSAAASADSLADEDEIIQFIINGQAYQHPDGEPTAYVNEQNRTMVPVSLFLKAMDLPGYSLRWDEQAQTAVIHYASHSLTLTNGTSEMIWNGNKVKLDSKVEATQGRLFAPVRTITEALGGLIAYESYHNIIYITTEPYAIASHSPEQAKELIEEQAAAVLGALAAQDFNALADQVDPKRGVRFSPFTYVDAARHTVLSREALASQGIANKVYNWGIYDGSGEDIELSLSDYYKEFIYPHDYREAPQVSYNQQLFHGNMINNAAKVYPGSIIVEYHFEEINPEYAGLDWRSLRLVFQPAGGQWYLVGIINDQWTT